MIFFYFVVMINDFEMNFRNNIFCIFYCYCGSYIKHDANIKSSKRQQARTQYPTRSLCEKRSQLTKVKQYCLIIQFLSPFQSIQMQ